MLSIPQTQAAQGITYVTPPEKTDVAATSTQAAETQRSTLLASSTVSISRKIAGSHTFLSDGVAKYAAIDKQSPPAAAADTVLKFIATRLDADVAQGASQDALASRLKAAYEGFLGGYDAALTELSAAGPLTTEVEHAIRATYEAVIAGIDRLAATLGLASPLAAVDTPAAAPASQVSDAGHQQISESAQVLPQPVSPPSPQRTIAEFVDSIVRPRDKVASLIESSLVNYASSSFNFRLKTRDGDEILVAANAVRGSQGSVGTSRAAALATDHQSGRAGAVSFAGDRFNLQVTGEVDEDELRAIGDLLNQIGELSSAFFAGDIEQAFAMALTIGFDESEIANFSLKLRQETYTKVTAAYGRAPSRSNVDAARPGLDEVLNFANGNNSLARLAGFVQMVEDITVRAEATGIERAVVPELAAWLANQGSHEGRSGGKIRALLENLLPRLASFRS